VLLVYERVFFAALYQILRDSRGYGNFFGGIGFKYGLQNRKSSLNLYIYYNVVVMNILSPCEHLCAI